VLGLVLLVAGIIIIVAALILVSTYGAKRGRVKVAGVVIIGPIPIIFCSDKKSVKTVMILAVILTIVALIATVLYYLLLR
jgi:uncharacterized protein (TIGR00304 family)